MKAKYQEIIGVKLLVIKTHTHTKASIKSGIFYRKYWRKKLQKLNILIFKNLKSFLLKRKERTTQNQASNI